LLAAAVTGLALLARGSAHAQTVPVVKPVAVTPAKPSPETKAVEFSEMGSAIAGQAVRLPVGAEIVRQLSAPLGTTGETVLLNFYKQNNNLFTDVLTSKNGQAWTRRNHLRLPSPLPAPPGQMSVTMRYLNGTKRIGYLIVASADAGSVTMAFPKGFGGTVKQQVFLASTPAAPTVHLSYNFGDLDSRGFVIVRSTVDSAGEVKPSGDVQYFVWNGTQFIARKPN